MTKPRSHGSLIELRAMAYLFKRNVLLFESFTVGALFVQESDFKDTFQIFRTRGNHFDTIFAQGYIENAAFCQALCYEILYSFVYKLPDVLYAVERMLHDPIDYIPAGTEYKSETNSDEYSDSIYLEDGRGFLLDRPEHTKCILEDYHYCHFHNDNFEELTDGLNHEMWVYSEDSIANNTGAAAGVLKKLHSLLPEKYMSCVRQLLIEGRYNYIFLF